MSLIVFSRSIDLAGPVPEFVPPESSSRPDSRHPKTGTCRRNFPPTTDDNGSAVGSSPPPPPGLCSVAARPGSGTPHWAGLENGSSTRRRADGHAAAHRPNRSNGPDQPIAVPAPQNRTRPASRVRNRPGNESAARPTARLPADVPASSVHSRRASGSPARPGSTPVRQPHPPRPALLPVPPLVGPTAGEQDRPFQSVAAAA